MYTIFCLNFLENTGESSDKETIIDHKHRIIFLGCQINNDKRLQTHTCVKQ